jgi:O-acetyl-ADP-ribose deacetylase (regulator of RNase III)
MDLRVVEGDLLDQEVEVIVNAWNRNIIPWWLLLPQGVSGAIKRRAGYEPFRELARRGPIPLGGAVETSAGRLPFRAIIHVAGISLFWRSSERAIRGCVRSALGIARERGYRSIAFPLIGAGTGGFSPGRALDLMQDEARLTDYAGEVRLVRFKTSKPFPKTFCAALLGLGFMAIGATIALA